MLKKNSEILEIATFHTHIYSKVPPPKDWSSSPPRRTGRRVEIFRAPLRYDFQKTTCFLQGVRPVRKIRTGTTGMV